MWNLVLLLVLEVRAPDNDAHARIARGWTQRQLAEALGMAEQQIQRYEANDYRSTSLARLCDIANALGVTVAQHAELNPSAA